MQHPSIWDLSIFIFICVFLIRSGCHQPNPRSEQSFDDIRSLVQDQSAAQVLLLFGKPDTKQVILERNERWMWHDFTRLDGERCPQELRGLVVHLEITFRNPSRLQDAKAPYSQWFVHEMSGVLFKRP